VKNINNPDISMEIIVVIRAYFRPIHILGPLENGTRYFSRSREFGCSHLSGAKLCGSGKMSPLKCKNLAPHATTV
jgi:hypothetical protein